MKYCKKCLQCDTRPNIEFSKDGICPACDYFELHSEVDWTERTDILNNIANEYRNPSAQYDCIIGVSGGKDSTRQAIFVKEQLGMNPLLVCLSPPPQQLTMRGANNISAKLR